MAVCLRRKHLCLPVTGRLRKSQCPIVTGNSPLGLWLPLSSATPLQIVTLLNCDTFTRAKHPERYGWSSSYQIRSQRTEHTGLEGRRDGHTL